MARFTEELLAKRDDPIYREGLTVFTPYTARSPRTSKPPAKKPPAQADQTKVVPFKRPRRCKPKTQK